MAFVTKAEPPDAEFLWTVNRLLSANNDSLNRQVLELLLRETQLHPFVAEYWDWLSRCYLCLGERESAKEAFRKFIVLSLGKISFTPSNDLLMLEYPRMIEELGGAQDAESIYVKAFSQQPRNLQVIKALSNFYTRHKVFDKSLEILENGVSTTHDVSLQIETIRVLGLLDRGKEALEYAERAMKSEKGNSLLHEAVGKILLSREDYKKAEIQFRKAVDLDPANPRHWHHYGLSLYCQKKLNDAEEALQKSVELDESFYEAWNTLGTVYRELENFSDAERVLKSIIEKWPTKDSAYSNLGALYVASGMSHKTKECLLKAEAAVLSNCEELLEEKKFSECMDKCVRASQYNPKSSLACAFCSIVFIEMEMFDKALEFIEMAIGIDPRCSEALAAKAYFELANKRLGRAERFALEAVELKPGSGRALHTLAVIQNEVGKYPEAERNIRKFLEQKPTSSMGMLHLARSLLGQGRVAESMTTLGEALFHDPWNAALWFSISSILSKVGLVQDAAAALQRAREIHPGVDEKVAAFRDRSTQ